MVSRNSDSVELWSWIKVETPAWTMKSSPPTAGTFLSTRHRAAGRGRDSSVVRRNGITPDFKPFS